MISATEDLREISLSKVVCTQKDLLLVTLIYSVTKIRNAHSNSSDHNSSSESIPFLTDRQ